MTAKRIRSIEFVLDQEGGYSDHPNDKGGRTMWGITEAYDNGEFIRLMGWNPFASSPLKIPRHEAALFYERGDWKELRCEKLEWPLCLALLDFGVNAGRSRAVKALQDMLGTKQDGAFGPITMSYYDLFLQGNIGTRVTSLALDLTDRRLQHLVTLALKTQYQPFMLGWMRRIIRLQVEIHKDPNHGLPVDLSLKFPPFNVSPASPKSSPSSPTSETTSPSALTSTPTSSSDEDPGTDSGS